MKYTQISAVFNNTVGISEIFALGEDGKVYMWCEKEYYDVKEDNWVFIGNEESETILIEGKFNG